MVLMASMLGLVVMGSVLQPGAGRGLFLTRVKQERERVATARRREENRIGPVSSCGRSQWG